MGSRGSCFQARIVTTKEERDQYIEALASAADSTEGERHPVRVTSLYARSMFSSALAPEDRLGFALASDDDSRLKFALRFNQLEGDEIKLSAVALCGMTMEVPPALTFQDFLDTLALIQKGGHKKIVRNPFVAVLYDFRQEIISTVSTNDATLINDLVLMAAKAKLGATHWADPTNFNIPTEITCGVVKCLKRVFANGGPQWYTELREKVAGNLGNNQ